MVSQCEIDTMLTKCLNSVLNVKVVVAAFYQEKALVGAFSVITNLRMEAPTFIQHDTTFTLQTRYAWT